MKFSRMPAGIISTNAIQLQFLLNQASLRVKFKIINRIIDARPQGNKRKVDGFAGVVAINKNLLLRKDKHFFENGYRISLDD